MFMKITKVFILLVCAIMLFSGCSKNTASVIEEDQMLTTYEVRDFVDDIDPNVDVINSGTMVELAHEYTPDFMLDQSDAVVLASVISIDDSDMAGFFGYTYGNLLIQDVYYGGLEKGEVVEYAKPGATMITRMEYENSLPEAAREKNLRLFYENGGTEDELCNTYYNITVEGDIKIEAGKTYMMYLYHSEENDNYEIIGLGNGLREVDFPQVNSLSLMSSIPQTLKIKNNETGEWEDLDTYLDSHVR